MAEKVIALRADMVAIADAIRAKLGSEDPMTIKEMDEKIGEISAGGTVKATKTIYLDWSEDYEWTEKVEYSCNGEKIAVFASDGITEIEADNGVVFCYDSRSYATNAFTEMYFPNLCCFLFREDYGTLHLYTDGSQDN